MRLAQRLTLAVILALVSVLALHGWHRARRESALLDREGRRDHLLLGRALGTGMTEAWRRAGESAALALVDTMNQSEAEIEIRWVWLDAPGSDPSGPRAPTPTLRPVARGREVAWVERRPGRDERLFTYVPVRLPSGRPGAIELSESRSSDAQFVRTSVRNAVTATAAAALACSVMVMALGVLLVGRPVRLLVAQARRVGAGDFSARLRLSRRDELGELAEEMNAMCDRLATAHARLLEETAARLAAQQRLEHADRLATVGRLAAGIAHELGTPLNVIAQRSQMVLAREVAGDGVVDAVRIVAGQTERITAIIRQLLDFARRRGPAKSVCDLRGVAEGAVSLLTPLAQKRGVTITLVQPEAPIQGELDTGQIHQALANLIVNAIDAMPGGGAITVSVSRAWTEPPVELAHPPGEHARIDVRDEGTGIPDDALPHVFEPFFTTKEVGEGTGLGLSVAYGLVREHGGWIAARNHPDGGTLLTLYLPLGGFSQ
ncbi:MAG: HAMP domain-containing sensor histidine kinase [Deltaproteobacteria bacterium]|nr:HAMP domain-containing sensor histidine kinase [Myxococcales bacterium]MDP3212840.1 HAMP domain-containing sensor histidine kinase [Deltaproteobacteria bacterium]